MRAILFPPILGLAFCGPAFAHEFWISPDTYSVLPEETITAELRVGENFKGPGYAYIGFRTERFDYVIAGEETEVPARMGDRPAVNMPAPENGLLVLVHETTDSTLTYTEWAKFQNFVRHKDFAGVFEQHRDRGLPETGFKESYRRFAKSLIAVGDGAGRDGSVGLETEIVAVTNPYTDDLSDGMIVDVLYDLEPRGDAQVELFERAPDGAVTVSLHRTDAAGRASFPVKSGHEYLVDAVVLRPTDNDDPEAGPVWHSLWASLTFKVPD
ncbi:MAG: DUF4198 domain-containing protein [Pseudomonadota bacterium]